MTQLFKVLELEQLAHDLSLFIQETPYYHFFLWLSSSLAPVLVVLF
jgi:hypothetical protein